MNDLRFGFIKRSGNSKTGPIPVSTSPMDTCPISCPLRNKNGCYADSGGPLFLHWQRLSHKQCGISYSELLSRISDLPNKTLWRHNQAGDLMHSSRYVNTISKQALDLLIDANYGKRGYTYTHYPIYRVIRNNASQLTPSYDIRKNYQYIKTACNSGFVINISCDSPNILDTVLEFVRLADPYIKLPIVTLLPLNAFDVSKINTKKYHFFITPQEHKVLICPAMTSDHITCQTCQLCAVHNRKYPIGFIAHGTRKKLANAISLRK